MALRIRQSGEILCAAKHEAQPDDVYLPDGLHYRLSVDYGIVVPEPDEATTGRWRWAKGAERMCLVDPLRPAGCELRRRCSVSRTTPHYQYIVLHQSCRNHLGVVAVQAAHAAGESVVGGPAPPDTHIVALVAERSADIEAVAARLREAGIHHVVVKEPDEPYCGAAVALGTEPRRDRETLRPLFSDFKVFR